MLHKDLKVDYQNNKMETHRHIKDRLLKTASTIWGMQGTQTESSFDPLVGILLGACATELEKVAHDIEETRGRTLERLVNLLYPEVLAQAMPAHAIAYAYPTEPSIELQNDAQFYFQQRTTLPGESNVASWKNIFFSPSCNMNLFRSHVQVMATARGIYEIDEFSRKDLLLANDKKIITHQNAIWLGISNPENLMNDAPFYFDLRNESGRTIFYDYLPLSKWYVDDHLLKIEKHYGRKINIDNRPNPKEIINGKANIIDKVLKHVNHIHAHQFVTLQSPNGKMEKKDWPATIKEMYGNQLLKMKKMESLGWIRIDFPENVNPQMMDDGLVISLNCFPVLNRRLIVHQHKLMEHLNIIPLAAENDEYFLDVADITDMESRELLGFNKTDDDAFISLHYGGVERFNEKDAVKAVESLIQQLRNESVAFSNMGFDFFNNEIKALQQNLNKLEQQLQDKQLMKGDTPYLMIADKEKIGTSNIFIKYWSTNGEEANNVRSTSPLQLHNNMDVESNSVRLLTPTQGGRNQLSDKDKVLAYKSALLSKEKLVTHEDIVAFCRLRLAMQDAAIEVVKGYCVKEKSVHGFLKTIQVHIQLNEFDMRSLLEKATLAFWQLDLETAIQSHSNFFMPIQVFITQSNETE